MTGIRVFALILVLSGLVSGCSFRPDDSVLTPVPDVAKAQVVMLHAVTNRAPVSRPGADASGVLFGNGRAQGLSATRFSISIPPAHRIGDIEWPDGSPDPRTDMFVVARQDLPLSALVDDVAPWPRRTDVRVFVHGYNTSYPEGLFRLAQIAHDSGGEGAAILFAWPSTATLMGYAADREAATYSRDHLADLLTMLARDQRIGPITVLGHSMGGWLVMETLRQLRLGGDDATLRRLQVVLAAPDIDMDVFRAQLGAVGPLEPPLTVLVASDDRALRVSARVNAPSIRVGALDLGDPRMAAAAKTHRIALVDISDLQSPDAQGHSRYAILAALQAGLRPQPGEALWDAGAFVLGQAGAAASSPVILITEKF